ncbi:MAG: hypothetical protein O2887_04380 [Bacteroidetes bacterium]|nr:hypothetical protein [Bacteroidota bacterium]MDA1119722.1 hypothetical protein [Bacteroidota bacterium]
MQKIILWFSVVTAIFLYSCAQDDPVALDDLGTEVNIEIRPYIESFVQVAGEHGESFDFKKFEATLTFEEIDENEDICGQSSQFHQKSNSIIIRANDKCWIGQPETTREALVYHELGHALLDRPHRDDRFENGLVKSIMETGTLGPYNQYTPILKAYLIDELFDETIPDPEWTKDKTAEYELSINSSVESGTAGWDFLRIGDVFNRGESYGERTNEFAADGDYSLKIIAGKEYDATPAWRLRISSVNDVPETADLVLTVRVKLQSIVGTGVSIAGGFDINGQILTFKSSENDLTLAGTSDFQTYQLVIPYFPNTPPDIKIVLFMLPNTTGVAYFDDIRLIAKYNPAFGPA